MVRKNIKRPRLNSKKRRRGRERQRRDEEARFVEWAAAFSGEDSSNPAGAFTNFFTKGDD